MPNFNPYAQSGMQAHDYPTFTPQQPPAQAVSEISFATMTEEEKIRKWISDLAFPHLRDQCLLELSKRRESVQDLAPLLWHSFGSIAALLNEITNIYPQVMANTLTMVESNRVCNALAMLQCVASHNETRTDFFNTELVTWLFPFLKNTNKEQPYEYLRLTTLGVIGALVKVDDPVIIDRLLSTDLIPLCLRIMEVEAELSKTVATFILQKILMDDKGLSFVCQTYERFSHIAMILGKMVIALKNEPSQRLLRHVVRCYLRLSYNPRAREALRQCLPDQMRDYTFHFLIGDDTTTRNNISTLLANLTASPQIG